MRSSRDGDALFDERHRCKHRRDEQLEEAGPRVHIVAKAEGQRLRVKGSGADDHVGVCAQRRLGVGGVGVVDHADAVPGRVHAHQVRPQVVVRVVVKHDGVDGLLVVVDDLRPSVHEQIPADARPGGRIEAVELHRD